MEYSKKPKKKKSKGLARDDFDPLASLSSIKKFPESSPAHRDVSNPQNARDYYLRGLSFEKRGDHLRAIADYDKAISLDSRLAWAYYRRALMHGAEGNRAQQSKDLQAAARLGLWMAVDMLTLNSINGKGNLI